MHRGCYTYRNCRGSVFDAGSLDPDQGGPTTVWPAFIDTGLSPDDSAIRSHIQSSQRSLHPDPTVWLWLGLACLDSPEIMAYELADYIQASGNHSAANAVAKSATKCYIVSCRLCICNDTRNSQGHNSNSFFLVKNWDDILISASLKTEETKDSLKFLSKSIFRFIEISKTLEEFQDSEFPNLRKFSRISKLEAFRNYQESIKKVSRILRLSRLSRLPRLSSVPKLSRLSSKLYQDCLDFQQFQNYKDHLRNFIKTLSRFPRKKILFETKNVFRLKNKGCFTAAEMQQLSQSMIQASTLFARNSQDIVTKVEQLESFDEKDRKTPKAPISYYDTLGTVMRLENLRFLVKWLVPNYPSVTPVMEPFKFLIYRLDMLPYWFFSVNTAGICHETDLSLALILFRLTKIKYFFCGEIERKDPLDFSKCDDLAGVKRSETREPCKIPLGRVQQHPSNVLHFELVFNKVDFNAPIKLWLNGNLFHLLNVTSALLWICGSEFVDPLFITSDIVLFEYEKTCDIKDGSLIHLLALLNEPFEKTETIPLNIGAY
ncbi:hypothetical protein WN51_09618 [Melipona quadrifasciata]|uniref:Uncharacterized protein n=1 Tax=Melipona quadrifasciata TaxID=166423 RepID=A0A0M8ZPV8_9HYME|nr:hypothetical protein WN51_09618 [Melipona quadrifasciata]